ncbi:hypothetical protein VUR80DRAFT_7300 [Thermomyces stellatus]
MLLAVTSRTSSQTRSISRATDGPHRAWFPQWTCLGPAMTSPSTPRGGRNEGMAPSPGACRLLLAAARSTGREPESKPHIPAGR